MGSPFDAAMAAADAVIGATFGEPVLITPRLKVPSKAHAPDPARVARSVRATFTQAPVDGRTQGERTGTLFAGMGRVAGAETMLWLDARELARLGYAPRAPDLITLTGRAGAPTYAVAKPMPDDAGGLFLTLTAEG